LSKNIFENYSDFYDLFYQGKDYEAESEYVKNLLNKFNIRDGEILELGCGTGRHAHFLTNYGYKVHGIEKSSKMVSRANLSKDFFCEVGDITDFNIGKLFDSAISLFHVMSYMTEKRSFINALSNANKHLKKGGIFIFDVWYSPAVYSDLPSNRVRHVTYKDTIITRVANPQVNFNENVVEVEYEFTQEAKNKKLLGSFKETHKMRHFSLLEIDLAAEMTGFKRVLSEEFLTKNPPSNETWGVCFVLKKINEKIYTS